MSVNARRILRLAVCLGFASLLPPDSNVEAQDAYIAEVRMFAGNFAPRGWAFCEGQILSISENQALFSLLGTTYGGDGRTTFALPDLRGRTPVHPNGGKGLTPIRLGQKEEGAAVYRAVKNEPTTTVQVAPHIGINYIICVVGIYPSRN